jgi:hypothetical protein
MSDNQDWRRIRHFKMIIQSPTAETDLVAHDLLAALLSGDLSRAERCATPLTPESLLETAHACMRGRRWADAAWVLDRIESPTADAQIKRCFCKNLACLQLHRPAVYQTIVTLPTETRCGISAAAEGRPTIIVRRGNGESVCLSPGNNPLANVAQAMRDLKPALEQGYPLGLCGIGDGYLFNYLAHNPPKLFLNMEVAVFLIEPDAQVLLHCLMIHDYTGPGGPIQQRRFRWYVGSSWREEITHVLVNDPYLPCPAVTVCQGLDSTPLAAALRDLSQVMAERDARLKSQVDAYYAELAREELAALLGPRPPRQPRVLLMTTRFSTVLQYSTRDAADAFEKLGWEARVVIEPTNHHRLLQSATRSQLANFKPDLVFQIDHLRYEHPGLFPPTLPFACWIQDHLPNLRTQEAARSISSNDFVLTDSSAMYGSTFSYPRRQCISVTKLTRIPSDPVNEETQRGDDLVFVSNASHIPAAIIAERLASFDGTPHGKELLAEAAKKLVDLYAAGQSVPTYYELLELIHQVQRELAKPIGVEEFDVIAAWLFHPLNDALYRQQALRWVRDTASAMSLSFAIYGAGWSEHPDFAEHARGSIQYGPALETLTRSSRFNLQIVPYHCLHQRLLDGLVAGGFYLVRQHRADTAARELIDFLLAHAPHAHNLEAARRSLSAPLRAQLDVLAALLKPAIATSEQDDPVEAARAWHEMRLAEAGQEVLPHFGLTSFDDAQTLRTAIARFAADPELRESVQQEQRQSVIDRFTYEAGLGRVVAKMHELLSDSDIPPKSKIEHARALAAGSRTRRAV